MTNLQIHKISISMLCLWFELLGKLSLLKQIFYGPKIDEMYPSWLSFKTYKYYILLMLSLRLQRISTYQNTLIQTWRVKYQVRIIRVSPDIHQKLALYSTLLTFTAQPRHS